MHRIAQIGQKALKKLRRYGVRNVLYGVALNAVNRFVPFKVLRGVYVEQPDPGFLDIPAPYAGKFFGASELREFARDPDIEMSEEFLDHALGKGDECYGFTSKGTPAAYGWYASNATSAVAPELLLHFSPGYVYMYRGFTHDDHRGKRLHAIGMTRALQHYLSKGYNGVVSYIESTNFDSLKSCARMGYQVFGSIYMIKLFGRYLTFSSPGCARFAFRLECLSTGAAQRVALGKN
jgi:hypothetical protein